MSLTATSTASISATAFGVAVVGRIGGLAPAIAAAGSGASATNTITDTIEASIQDGSKVTAH